MNTAKKNLASAALAAMLCCGALSAQAAMVVYEDVDFIKGTDAHSESFTIKQAGTYQATLSDFKFPNNFSQLDLLVSTSVAPEVGKVDGPGTFTFLANPGTYWASVAGVTDKPLDIGLYGIRIEQVSVSPVPLPTSLVMLGSALVAFIGVGRGAARVAL